MTGYDERFYAWRDSNTRASAQIIVEMFMDLMAPRSVVDLGCGVGTWLATFLGQGVEDVLGIEGEWARDMPLRIDSAQIRFHDLTERLTVSRRFDLALCLEVAEHLPADVSRSLVGTLTELADVVAFSAAIPFQGGVGHVNEQWPEYWAHLFAMNDYVACDAVRSRLRGRPDIKFWYAQNLILYVRAGRLSDYPTLAASVREGDPGQLSRVHPALYLRNSDPQRQSLRQVLGALPSAARRAVVRRLARLHPQRDG